MRLTPNAVSAEREWIRDRAPRTVETINDLRTTLGDAFETEVATVTEAAYRREVDAVFADGPRAVNVAGLVALLRELDVVDDYPGFVLDELLGRTLAATIAGGVPWSTLAAATFHFADVEGRAEGGAGMDDLDAALAAGFQTRLPGWAWTEGEDRFALDPAE